MAKIKMKDIRAHSTRIHQKRDKNTIKYIVFHYTGNGGDTSENNGKYFARTDLQEVKDRDNARYGVGAHFFIDKQGKIVRSIPIANVAWSVGGKYSVTNGAGKYYGKCTNVNSVSIELCDCLNDVSWEQLKAARQLVKYIQKKCPNATTIIRHWDVNGKNCPAPMSGVDNTKWNHLYNKVTKNYLCKVNVVEKANLKAKPDAQAENIGMVEPNEILFITKIVGKFGRLKNQSSEGKNLWINLNKTKEL